MVKLSEKQGFEKEILILVKFTRSEYVKDIIDGKLYMNTIRYFANLENKTRIKGQGDKYEAGNVISDTQIKIYKSGTDILLAEGHAEEMIQRDSFFDNIPIFCITAFEANDFKIIEEKENSYIVVFDINEVEISKMISDFGEKAILINARKFLNTIDMYFISKGIEYEARKVNYENLRINNEERIRNYSHLSLTPIFTKDQFFSYQKEFRVAVYGHRVQSNYIADIGDLSDTAIYVADTKEFFQNINLEVKKK